MFRVALVPGVVFLLHKPTRSAIYIAAVIFALGSISDFLDGYIARKYGAVSKFGKLVDPLADKLLVMAALVMLVAQRGGIRGDPWVPGWMVVLILAREFWVTALRGVAATEGIVLAADNYGKAKTAIQMIAIEFLILNHISFPFMGLVLTFQTLGLSLLFLSVIFSYLGAYGYTVSFVRSF